MSGNQENQEPCDCYESDCSECNQRVADQEEEREMDEHYRAIEKQEERDFQRSLVGGDDDDGDEEDPHGSRPIEEPDEDEEDEEDEEN